MPFAVAWTDALTRESFLDYHESLLEAWTPERWECNFVTFLDGRPVGTQGLNAEEPSAGSAPTPRRPER
jgi:hypothetical protein